MKAAPVTIRFTAELYILKGWTILAVPKEESAKLTSRGQISITGMLNGYKFSTVLEPDGRWNHWMRISGDLQKAAGVKSGNSVTVEMTTNATWPEPNVPTDLKNALAAATYNAKNKWQDITPMARWEWIRWVNSTANPDTRAIRLKKTVSKLSGTHRRPCCFNLAACTVPYICKNGKLIEVT